jgi:hypothetical protein
MPGSVDAAAIADGSITAVELNSSIYGAVGSVTAIDPDDAASAGVSTLVARIDHQHPITAGTPAALTRTTTSAESAGTGFARDVHAHATDQMAWGRIADQVLTSNNGAHTTNATTDHTLSATVLATRLYTINLNVLWNRSANGDWQVNVHVGGTLLTEIGRLGDNAVGANRYLMACEWKPSAGTFTVDIRVVEISGTADLTLLGGAGSERHFWIEDVGPRT